MKHVSDKDDPIFLNELQRLNILPKAHVYDPTLRPVRDLLRRLTNLVHQRTGLLVSNTWLLCPSLVPVAW